MNEIYTIDDYKMCSININNINFFFNNYNEIFKSILNNNVKAIWIEISMEHINLIEFFKNENYVFHYINKTKNLIMIKVIKINRIIPNFSNHIISGGGIIINTSNEILLIQEKSGINKNWKLPGGRIEPNENIKQNMIREIEEETGLKNLEFLGMAFFREMRPYVYECGDIYNIGVFILKDNQYIVMQNSEIINIKFMKINEFIINEHNTPINLEIKKVLKFYVNSNLEEFKNKLLKPNYIEYKTTNSNINGLIWSPFL